VGNQLTVDANDVILVINRRPGTAQQLASFG
jgi:hypothetical protein